MRRFKSVAQTQQFLSIHDAVRNLSSLGRHAIAATSELTARVFILILFQGRGHTVPAIRNDLHCRSPILMRSELQSDDMGAG
jgi:hypothetical protein